MADSIPRSVTGNGRLEMETGFCLIDLVRFGDECECIVYVQEFRWDIEYRGRSWLKFLSVSLPIVFLRAFSMFTLLHSLDFLYTVKAYDIYE